MEGPTVRGLSTVIEWFSGHYSGYRSFKAADGVPGSVGRAGLDIEREQIVAEGNVGIYVVAPT